MRENRTYGSTRGQGRSLLTPSRSTLLVKEFNHKGSQRLSLSNTKEYNKLRIFMN
jgi:hypothetical protein